jgi:hypothetical protein
MLGYAWTSLMDATLQRFTDWNTPACAQKLQDSKKLKLVFHMA